MAFDMRMKNKIDLGAVGNKLNCSVFHLKRDDERRLQWYGFSVRHTRIGQYGFREEGGTEGIIRKDVVEQIWLEMLKEQDPMVV